jgi:D-alanine--poly(phosphoribitol) ligase subunit 2
LADQEEAICQRLGTLFSETFHVQVPAAEADLLATGLLDSLQLVELLLQLEQQFGVSISIEDIDLDDLRTLDRIARVVAARSVVEPAPARHEAMAQPASDADESWLRAVERRNEGRREEAEDKSVLAASLLAIDKT